MTSTTRRPASGFTLIELLTVIAIIGILAGIIIPAVSKVREAAKKAVDAANIGTIGKAAQTYASDNSDRLPDPIANDSKPATSKVGGDRFYAWMGMLAKSGGLDTPGLYFSQIDKSVPPPETIPASFFTPGSKTSPNPSVQSLTPALGFVGGLKITDPATTPVVFTRGLTRNGLWDDKLSPYGESGGGFIFFLGGNVVSYKAIEGKLTTPNNRRTTDNLGQAIPFIANGNQRIYEKGGAGLGSQSGVAPTPE